MQRIVADWEGPFKQSRFLTDPTLKQRFHCPGVYVRIETLPAGGARLAYVGRATGRPTLWQRQLQHYAHVVGGLYSIPKEFRASGREWVPDWTKSDTVRCLLDRADFAALVDDAFRYVEGWRVYLWVTPRDLNVHTAERNLLFDLKPTGTSWGTVSEPSPRLDICHRSPKWLTPEIQERLPDLSLTA